VPELPLGAGGGGGRVRGHHLAEHLRALSGRRSRRSSRALRDRAAKPECAHLGRHLDHDALDLAGQSRRWRSIRSSTTALVEFDLGNGRERLVLAPSASSRDAALGVGRTGAVLAEVKGAALENLMLQHPFYEREVPVILGDHVTLDAGTGAVHTAPGHGLEDYVVGRRYGCRSTIRWAATAASSHRRRCSRASKCSTPMRTSSRCWRERPLLKGEPYHSYPHCWRHKTPVIFRATPQWFISMDQAGLRKHALEDIKRTSIGCPPGASSASAA
jgi:hypothetical protein